MITMHERMGEKCRAQTERGKENTQEGSEKTHTKLLDMQRKAGDGFEEKKMETAVCNLQLIQRFKMWNFFLMPLTGSRECNWS